MERRGVFPRGVYTGLSAASGEPEDSLNVADNLGAGLLGCFENDARLVFVTGNVVAFKQHPLDGMINSRRLVDGLTGGRLAGDLTPQSLIVSRSDFNEYIHGVTLLWLRRLNSLNGSMGSNRAPSQFFKNSGKNQTNQKGVN
jgi:hypothetical protein